jgi:hypothetical protein
MTTTKAIITGVMFSLLTCLWCITATVRHAAASSVESCLSASLINLTQDFGSDLVLPVDCYCSVSDLTCINLKTTHFDEDGSPSLNIKKFPTLSILFNSRRRGGGGNINDTTSSTSEFYVLPKQKFSFFGYTNLTPHIFHNVKFHANDAAFENFSAQRLFINFIESARFPSLTFDSFGNLPRLAFDKWPKVYLSIFIEENNVPLNLAVNSISNVKIEKLLIQDASHQMLTTVKTRLTAAAATSAIPRVSSLSNDSSAFTIQANAFNNSVIDTLEIRNSRGFTGFTRSSESDQLSKNVVLNNLVVYKCPSFSLDSVERATELPAFVNLASLIVIETGMSQLPDGLWLDKRANRTRFEKLRMLDLNSNRLDRLNETALAGLESTLEHLDLSNNSIGNVDWTLFKRFSNLKLLNLSHNPLGNWHEFKKLIAATATVLTNRGVKSAVNTKLEVVSLKGFLFNSTHPAPNETVCLSSNCSSRMSSPVFIELNEDFECSCFLFSLYKSYRSHFLTIAGMDESAKTAWVRNPKHTVAKCYRELFMKTNDFTLIAAREAECLVSAKCGALAAAGGNAKTRMGFVNKNGVMVNLDTVCNRRKEYAMPGLTVIKVGNETAISNANNTLVRLNGKNKEKFGLYAPDLADLERFVAVDEFVSLKLNENEKENDVLDETTIFVTDWSRKISTTSPVTTTLSAREEFFESGDDEPRILYDTTVDIGMNLTVVQQLSNSTTTVRATTHNGSETTAPVTTTLPLVSEAATDDTFNANYSPHQSEIEESTDNGDEEMTQELVFHDDSEYSTEHRSTTTTTVSVNEVKTVTDSVLDPAVVRLTVTTDMPTATTDAEVVSSGAEYEMTNVEVVNSSLASTIVTTRPATSTLYTSRSNGDEVGAFITVSEAALQTDSANKAASASEMSASEIFESYSPFTIATSVSRSSVTTSPLTSTLSLVVNSKFVSHKEQPVTVTRVSVPSASSSPQPLTTGKLNNIIYLGRHESSCNC